MTNPMLKRVAVAQACVAKFDGQAFAWGECDCARLAAFALQGLGYKPSYARFGRYRSALGARRALRREGFADTTDWIDSIHGLARIAPAAALPGDIVGLPGEEGWTALTVALGNGRLLGFHLEAAGCAVVQPLSAPTHAWRAAPCRS